MTQHLIGLIHCLTENKYLVFRKENTALVFGTMLKAIVYIDKNILKNDVLYLITLYIFLGIEMYKIENKSDGAKV